VRIRTAIDLGLVIRDRRRKLGFDQRTLADKVGVSRQWIVGIEKGKPGAEVGLLLRTLETLGLHVTVVSGQTSSEEPTTFALGIDIDAVIEKARGGKR
jgi:HTH-type transcriptional regulator/antitoxin HipB